MDFQKFTSGASDFFARTGQKFDEAFKGAERTPLDAELEQLHETLVSRRDWAKALLSLTMNMVQPNPAMRMEDAILSTVGRLQPNMNQPKERLTAGEQLGDLMTKIGVELGVSNQSSSMFQKCGEIQVAIGSAERDLLKDIVRIYADWLRELLLNITAAEEDWTKLHNARLDLDVVKKKVAGSKDGAAKVQLESDLQTAQSKFEQQSSVAKTSHKTCIEKFDDHKQLLTDFLQAQRNYFTKCSDLIAKSTP